MAFCVILLNIYIHKILLLKRHSHDHFFRNKMIFIVTNGTLVHNVVSSDYPFSHWRINIICSCQWLLLQWIPSNEYPGRIQWNRLAHPIKHWGQMDSNWLARRNDHLEINFEAQSEMAKLVAFKCKFCLLSLRTCMKNRMCNQWDNWRAHGPELLS